MLVKTFHHIQSFTRGKYVEHYRATVIPCYSINILHITCLILCCRVLGFFKTEVIMPFYSCVYFSLLQPAAASVPPGEAGG